MNDMLDIVDQNNGPYDLLEHKLFPMTNELQNQKNLNKHLTNQLISIMLILMTLIQQTNYKILKMKMKMH